MKLALVLIASLVTSCCVHGAPGQIKERIEESFEESLEETVDDYKEEIQEKVQEAIESAKATAKQNIGMKLKQIETETEQMLINMKPELQEELMELEQELQEVKQEFSEVRAEIAANAESFKQNLEVRIQELQQIMLQIQGRVATIQQKLMKIKQNIPAIQEELAEIKEEIDEDMAQIKQHIAATLQAGLQAKLASIEQKIQEMMPVIQQILEGLSTRISMRVEEIQQRFSQIEQKIMAIMQKVQSIKIEIPQIEAYLTEARHEIQVQIQERELEARLKVILHKAELEFEEMEMKVAAMESLTPEQLLILKQISENQMHHGDPSGSDITQTLLEKMLLEGTHQQLTPEQLLLLREIKSSEENHQVLMTLEQKRLEEKLLQGIQLNHEELLKLAELRAHRSGRSTLEELFLLHHVSVTPQQLILLKSFTPTQILTYFFLHQGSGLPMGNGMINSLVHHISELARTAAVVENNELILYNFLKSHQPIKGHLNLAELALAHSYQESMAKSIRRSKFLLMLSLSDIMHSEGGATQQQKILAETLLHRIRSEENHEWQMEELALLRRYAQGKASLAGTVAAYRQLEAMWDSGLGSHLRSLVMNTVRKNLVQGSGIGMTHQGDWMRGFLSNADWQNATESEKIHEIWVLYKLRHHKSYKTRLEESMRRRNFEKRLSEIVMHNIEYQLGKQLFTMGLNHLSDRTDEEVSQLSGYISTAQIAAAKQAQAQDVLEGEEAPHTVPVMPLYTSTGVSLPAYVNWTNTSWVGPIQDQYRCGSCWAFSAAGALEAQYYNKTKTFVTMSEQNLVDCTYYLGNLGCSGGNVELAYDYVMTVGIDTYASYPYTGLANNGTCKYNPANSVTTDSGWMLIPTGDELAMQQAVAQVGPVSAAIDASLSSFDSYLDGVYAPTKCSTTALDHAILVVGYGTTDAGQDYWLIKNSWGVDWGMKGYMMMARGVNMCGIATEALFPLIN